MRARTSIRPSKLLAKSQPLFYETPLLDELMLFGENMTATHSMSSRPIFTFFLCSTSRPCRTWLSTDDTKAIANRLNLPTAPLLFSGFFASAIKIKSWIDTEISKPSILGGDREGFVIRIASEIKNDSFDKSIAKYVGKGHIQTDKHWTDVEEGQAR